MLKSMKFRVSIAILTMAIFLSACGMSTSSKNGNEVRIKSTRDAMTIPTVTKAGTRYVSVNRLAKVMGYQVAWNDAHDTVLLGGNDVQYTIEANAARGTIGGTARRLTQKPIVVNDDLLIPDTTVSEMFQSELKYFIRGNTMTLYAFPELHPDGKDFDFKDAPADQHVMGTGTGLGTNANVSGTVQAESLLSHVSIDKVISLAQTYIGVPYAFGAKSFDATHRFDCSSFTQYVYGRLGLKLPRSSRDQGMQGMAVSRQALKPGDLLFFYVPGRFRSNSIIGHVGLYMGGGQMIHATPSAPSGVKITSIDSSYWKQKFLSARRVATPL